MSQDISPVQEMANHLLQYSATKDPKHPFSMIYGWLIRNPDGLNGSSVSGIIENFNNHDLAREELQYIDRRERSVYMRRYDEAKKGFNEGLQQLVGMVCEQEPDAAFTRNLRDAAKSVYYKL